MEAAALIIEGFGRCERLSFYPYDSLTRERIGEIVDFAKEFQLLRTPEGTGFYDVLTELRMSPDDTRYVFLPTKADLSLGFRKMHKQGPVWLPVSSGILLYHGPLSAHGFNETAKLLHCVYGWTIHTRGF